MYINKKNHILSGVIFGTALFNLVFESVESIQRLILKRAYSTSPDMLEMSLWNSRMICSFIKLMIIMVLFYIAWMKLKKLASTVGDDDMIEMAKLQREALGDKLSSLSAYSISQLMQLWAAIFIGAELVYDVTSIIYRDFVAALSTLFDMSDQAMANAFVDFYNNTHGFKYMGMQIAIMLGIFVTGVFLKDVLLKIVAFAVTAVYTLAFMILSMNTLVIFNRSVGIVWTSVIFHMTQTVGLAVLAIYMSKKYKGL